MKPLLFICLLLLTLSGCISESSLKPVIPNHLISANSAKTWVKTGYTKNGKDLVPHLNESQMTYTFFDNGTFKEQRLIHLGSKNGKKGNFNWKVTETNDTVFTLLYYGEHSITLELEYLDTKLMKLKNDTMNWTLETLQPPKLK